MTTRDRPHSVLIVEDEGIFAMDLQQTLLEMGYDAFAIASNATDALNRASERCPDLVLMDIRIKGSQDGVETAGLLRERFGVPVIYLTAHADEATVERAKKTEPSGYLMKPIKPAELRSAIEVSIYRHGMERLLRERERWFSTTLRSIGDAVIAVDLSGRVTFINPAAEALVGVASTEALGHPAREIVRLQTPDVPRSPLDEVLVQRRNLTIEEASLAHPTKTDRIISDSATMVVDRDELLGAVMVFRDVTEQRSLQKRLEVSDRLASLGTLAAGVAHEVNNPLAVVVANAAYVESELRDLRAHFARLGGGATELARFDELLGAQGEIEPAAKRIARIVSDLRLFARPAVPSPTESDVARAVHWVVRSTEHELRHRARVVTDIPAALPRVKVDETRLGQILVNLMVNAGHAIASGHFDDNEVSVRARAEGDAVVIEVRDTGAGMTPEVLKQVFDPFFTTREVGVGTGLGLAICHGIATSVGGHIEAESELGRGSVFRLFLPAAQPKRTDEAPTPAPVVAPRRGRILLVDDEPMVLRTLKRVLGDHDVVALEGAAEALALLERGERFDMIFSDVIMPHMTGMELYERLLRERPDVAARVVFLSGGAQSVRELEFLASIPNTCLEKPISFTTLRAFVQQRLGAG